MKAFTLVEVIIGISLILIIFLGIFSSYQLILKIIGQSKARTIAVAIANQKMEQIINKSYEDIGTKTGYPEADIDPITEITRDNILFTIDTRIDYIDDDKDGSAPDDVCPNDYKKVQIKVSWQTRFGGGDEVFFDNIIAPRDTVQECGETGGVLKVSVFNAKGEMVAFPLIQVENLNTGLLKTAQPESGEHKFVLPEGIGVYKIQVSKTGYSSSQTYGTGEQYQGQIIANPEKPHTSVLEGRLTENSFCIDKLSSFLVRTLEAKANHIYYVRKSGSDDKDGLSRYSPFLTIQKAADVMRQGDMVFIGAGDYEEEITPMYSGTLAEPIIFIADISGVYTGDSGQVRIAGQEFGFNISNKKHLKIYGFSFDNTINSAICISNSSEFIEIENNIISDNFGKAIFISNSSNINLSQNIIFSNQEAVYLDNSSHNQIVSNLIYDNQKQGVLLFNNSVNNNIFNNTIFKNQDKGIHIAQNSDSNKIKNNIIAENFLTGISVSDSCDTESDFNNVWQNFPDYDGLFQGDNSICSDPLFIDSEIKDFHISQISAGQAQDSPCLDVGSDSAQALEMNEKTTRTDNLADSGLVDMGYHYPINSLAPEPFGAAIPNTEFFLQGEKVIGQTSDETNIYKYSVSASADDNGQIEIQDMEWDSYHFFDFNSEGVEIDLIISWDSLMPINLFPDAVQEVKLGLKAENTLLVKVYDSLSFDPLFSANTRVYNAEYDKEQFTDESGEAYFIPLKSSEYNLTVETEGYENFEGAVFVNGHKQETILLDKLP